MKIFDLTSIQVKECIERNPSFYECIGARTLSLSPTK